MAERLIRGNVILGYLAYVKKTWGKEGLERVKKDIGIHEIHIKDSQFYTNEIMVRLLDWITMNYGIERVKQAGNFTVKNLGIFAYLVRFMDMESMLHRAEDRFREMYKFGEVGVDIDSQSKRAVAVMKDVAEKRENCLGWQGAFEAMLELTRTKGTVTHTECQVDGGSQCTYVIEWN